MEQSRSRDIITVVITAVFVIGYMGLTNSGLFSLTNLLNIHSDTAFYIDQTIGVWILLIPTVIFMFRDKESLIDIGFMRGKIFLQLLVGLVLGIVSIIIFTIISVITGVEFFMGLRSMSFDFGSITLTLFHALLTWALVEEIIYRGHLYKKVKNITNSMWAAVIITSLIFSAKHMFSFDNLHIFLPMAFIFGLLCCICREKIKHCSLLSLIIAHSVNNMLMYT